MKKGVIVVLAMAALTVGAVSASAAGPCCNTSKCADKQALQDFSQETSGISSALKVKEAELRTLYGYEGVDAQQIKNLEAEINLLKKELRQSATKHGISTCCV